MFSMEARCIYRKNQLEEVICQLRFPEILSIGANAPVEFQEAIREQYPVYRAHPAAPAMPWMGAATGQPDGKSAGGMSYAFATPDNVWRVDLNSHFISLTCREYERWELFARQLDRPLAEFIRIYKPAYFERIGLRYLNFFSRTGLELEEVPYRELIAERYLGVLAEEEIRESGVTRSMVEAEFPVRGCMAHIHSGVGRIRRGTEMDPELKFIFDQDLYLAGQTPVNRSAGALETMHGAAWSVFRGAVTSRLHEAMEPEEI